MKTKIAYFNYIEGIELPIDCVNDCSHSGPCDNDVNFWIENDAVKKELSQINSESLIKELDQHGAWSSDELKNHKDNLMRILWIAANDIMEQI